jgi:hypothetical protein
MGRIEETKEEVQTDQQLINTYRLETRLDACKGV